MHSANCDVWTFTGLEDVDIGSQDKLDLADGFSLSRPTTFLLSARSGWVMNERERHDMEHASCFLIHRESQPIARGPERDAKTERFQNGLTALQILKPTKSLGFIFQGSELETEHLSVETISHRPPINPGEWARMRTFDSSLMAQVPGMIRRVRQVMDGPRAEPKNAIIFLQLALEHFHPLIAGLLCVMGLDALFNSISRWEFRDKLCQCLGKSTSAFPDWNSPHFSVPNYTVDQIAVDIYMLRNTISHGIDLRKAASDKNSPVDLLRNVTPLPQLPERAYAVLLSEAAAYLLCQVLQKTI